MLIAGLSLSCQTGLIGQAFAQPPGSEGAASEPESAAPSNEAAPSTDGVDGGRIKDDPEMIAKTMAEMPEDIRKDAEEIYAEFRSTHEELLDSMLELREIHIRFNNDVDRSREATKAFREQQHKTWDLMQKQMENSVKVFRLLPSPEAASYMVTMVQHHFDNDIYDRTTFEAAARLIDIGQNYRYLFLTAARAGISTGNFETARKVYESLQPDELEKVDMANKHFLDLLEKQYKEETLVGI